LTLQQGSGEFCYSSVIFVSKIFFEHVNFGPSDNLTYHRVLDEHRAVEPESGAQVILDSWSHSKNF